MYDPDGGLLVIVNLIDHWQTLAAGLLALVGASWTVRGLRDEIKQQSDLAQEERERKELERRRAGLKAIIAGREKAPHSVLIKKR